jgi:hypothetical protein
MIQYTMGVTAFNQAFWMIKDGKLLVGSYYLVGPMVNLEERIWTHDEVLIPDRDIVRLNHAPSSGPEIILAICWFGVDTLLVKPDPLVKQVSR